MVLIISIGVSDHIRAKPQASVEPCHEIMGKTLIVGVANDMVNIIFPSNINCLILAAIINNQPLDRIKTCDLVAKP